MAFKINNPMKKNFGSALNITEEQEEKLNPGLATYLKKNEGKSPNEMKKDNAPMMRMDASAMKAMGKPAPVKMSHPMKTDRGRKAAEERKKPKFGEPGYKEPFEDADKFLTEDEMKKYEPTYND